MILDGLRAYHFRGWQQVAWGAAIYLHVSIGDLLANKWTASVMTTNVTQQRSSNGVRANGTEHSGFSSNRLVQSGLRRDVGRWLLLVATLLAFGRLVYGLESKDLWWDESLSLQRAESAWLALLQGKLIIYDSLSVLETTDQHPFFFFVLQGLLVRLAGASEYVLRFVSVMAGTLMAPALWATGRFLVRQNAVPPTTPYWAALYGAVHPFLLWYGQEARPYALWAVLALLSTYTLLRTVEGEDLDATWIGRYLLLLFMFLATHYYAVFLLPVHALLLYLWLERRSRWGALVSAVVLVAIGGVVSGVAYWYVIVRQGGGGNFASISWKILGPDLLNAFTLGLSVDIARVWYFDVAVGVIALLGVIWGWRSRSAVGTFGWLPVAMVLAPIGMLLILNEFYPAYMNARHLSLIIGGYVLLVAGGLGFVWHFQRWVALLLAVLLLAGVGYSSVNYFTQEEYAKDDFSRLGAYLRRRVVGDDVLLLKPSFSRRHFEYYLPLAEMDEAANMGIQIAYYGVPMLHRSWEERFALIEAMSRSYRRVWFVVSGTHPYEDLEGVTESWLDETLYRVQETTFFSHSSLKASLYLPEVPVYPTPPENIEYPLDIVFGNTIRLVGIDLGTPAVDSVGVPMTLYWQINEVTDVRYKYVVRLVEQLVSGGERLLAVTERESYEGAIPTVFWEPGRTIVDYSELPPADWPHMWNERFKLTLQIYAADSLEKLPITSANGAEIGADGETVYLPGELQLAEQAVE